MVDFDTRRNIEIVKSLPIWKIEVLTSKKHRLFIGILQQQQLIHGCLVFKGVEVTALPDSWIEAKEVLENKENQIEHLFPLDKIQQATRYTQTN